MSNKQVPNQMSVQSVTVLTVLFRAVKLRPAASDFSWPSASADGLHVESSIRLSKPPTDGDQLRLTSYKCLQLLLTSTRGWQPTLLALSDLVVKDGQRHSFWCLCEVFTSPKSDHVCQKRMEKKIRKNRGLKCKKYSMVKKKSQNLFGPC